MRNRNVQARLVILAMDRAGPMGAGMADRSRRVGTYGLNAIDQ
jgi:hypothetical protein